MTASATMYNAAPVLTGHPTLEFSPSGSDYTIAKITVPGFVDQGVLDTHTLKIEWGDGQVTEVEDSLVAQRNSLNFTKLFPITVSIVDDDGGAVSYRILKTDVAVNDNDSNENEINDLLETNTFSDPDMDPDITELDLSSMITGEMDSSSGQFLLSYDSTIVKLWTLPTKSELIGDGTEGTVKYSGQGTLYVEGVSANKTSFSLTYVPDDPEKHTIFAGTVIATG